MTGASTQALLDRLGSVSSDARKLFCVIVREAYHGPMHPKAPGVAVPAEILEACGLDVGDFYALLDQLRKVNLIQVSGEYPFEEIQLTADAAAAQGIAEHCNQSSVPVENIFVALDATLL